MLDTKCFPKSCFLSVPQDNKTLYIVTSWRKTREDFSNNGSGRECCISLTWQSHSYWCPLDPSLCCRSLCCGECRQHLAGWHQFSRQFYFTSFFSLLRLLQCSNLLFCFHLTWDLNNLEGNLKFGDNNSTANKTIWYGLLIVLRAK